MSKVQNVKRVFVTGVAGFIGSATALNLARQGIDVVGVDNLNSYYSPRLKKHRLSTLEEYSCFKFHEIDICNFDSLSHLILQANPDVIIHLAAQAGVRYSLENPHAYVDSNITGFLNVLQSIRALRSNNSNFTHLVYASSSSVYGGNQDIPYSITQRCDHPVSFYAATKKANELMAEAYAASMEITSIGLRFFTVYGPSGRPDMAYFKFAKLMHEGLPIHIYNNGDMWRDFTYIDDAVNGVISAVNAYPMISGRAARHMVYNIGNSQPEKLSIFVSLLEEELRRAGSLKGAVFKEYHPLQVGDVLKTYADIEASTNDLGFQPSTSLRIGLSQFAQWFAAHGMSFI